MSGDNGLCRVCQWAVMFVYFYCRKSSRSAHIVRSQQTVLLFAVDAVYNLEGSYIVRELGSA